MQQLHPYLCRQACPFSFHPSLQCCFLHNYFYLAPFLSVCAISREATLPSFPSCFRSSIGGRCDGLLEKLGPVLRCESGFRCQPNDGRGGANIHRFFTLSFMSDSGRFVVVVVLVGGWKQDKRLRPKGNVVDEKQKVILAGELRDDEQANRCESITAAPRRQLCCSLLPLCLV